MYITKLVLKNYRNIINQTIEFNKGINFIYGDNAQGKTNIIESIYFFTTGKSFRTKKDSELINFNKKTSEVDIFFKRSGLDCSGNFIIKNDSKKQIKINYVPINKIGNLMGFLNAVIFSPQDLSLIKDGPIFRRRFIDIFISQIKPKYFFDLQQYGKILKQRNSVLKKSKTKSSLISTISVWDEKLSEYAENIIKMRIIYIKKFKEIAIDIHNELTDGTELFDIKYENSFDNNLKYIDVLKNSIDKDIEYGFTQYGPHRDDLLFSINNMNVKKFASQGQQRSIVLTLKISEANLINEEIGEYPIILLDDIMSELDEKRQKYIINKIKDKQVILTGTEISKNINIDINLINISNGMIVN